jgi:hypothetical protein
VTASSAVVVIAALCELPAQRSDSGSGRAPDDCSLQTSPEQCPQRRPTGSSDQSTLTRPDSAIVMVVSPLIVTRVAFVISAPDMIVHPPVIGIAAIPLREYWHCGGHQQCSGHNISLQSQHDLVTASQLPDGRGLAILGLISAHRRESSSSVFESRLNLPPRFSATPTTDHITQKIFCVDIKGITPEQLRNASVDAAHYCCTASACRQH